MRLSHARGRFAAASDAARSALTRFCTDRGGATAIEYALIASLISIMIVAGATSIGSSLKDIFTSLSGSVK
ncbi:MAG: Flp family type IVb pilin [Alphaproteobacteria bacterium]|nr:Flp family type IVb pilin [Alphaproteobacteria bacterium]